MPRAPWRRSVNLLVWTGFMVPAISRFNLFTSMGVNGSPKPGFSSGNAIKAIQEVAAQTLPRGYGFEFSGMTREELSSGGQTVFIFLLCIMFVYFLLCAQYESYILPLAVLFSLPIGLAGAFLFATIFGIANNIYLQITLIMLVGLLAKNAILIVEFAVERRRKGLSIVGLSNRRCPGTFTSHLNDFFCLYSGTRAFDDCIRSRCSR